MIYFYFFRCGIKVGAWCYYYLKYINLYENLKKRIIIVLLTPTFFFLEKLLKTTSKNDITLKKIDC